MVFNAPTDEIVPALLILHVAAAGAITVGRWFERRSIRTRWTAIRRSGWQLASTPLALGFPLFVAEFIPMGRPGPGAGEFLGLLLWSGLVGALYGAGTGAARMALLRDKVGGPRREAINLLVMFLVFFARFV